LKHINGQLCNLYSVCVLMALCKKIYRKVKDKMAWQYT